CRPAEIGIGTEVTAAVAFLAAGALAVTQPAKGIADVTPHTVITPGYAQAQVQVPKPFVRNEIFTGEQTGTGQIHKAQGDLRHPVGFFPQPELGINRLILQALVATE